jgi:hypothetical protein
MSTGNELGPNIEGERLVFASDREGGAGGLDLYEWQLGEQMPSIYAQRPHPLEAINTPAYEAYWTELLHHDYAYFASDRDGQGLDAYRYDRHTRTIERALGLSSPADDTAFHMYRSRTNEIIMLFASNREGGQGDFDLYCSRLDESNNQWSAPQVLTYASSPNKDFRPIVMSGFFHDVLIFSSNRPGGQGGMDLYYVALEAPCASSPRRS